MARIGLIGDIHGNLVALDTVLAQLAAERIDQIVCLGDIAATGPQPHEVTARIRDLGCPTVQGNWDAWMVEMRAGTRPYEGYREIDRWCARKLDQRDLHFLDTLPKTLSLALDRDTVLCCFHGSPLSFEQRIDPTTPDDEVAAMLDGISATVFACGHTHGQMIRRYEAGYVINPGSISECWDYTDHSDDQGFSPWAEYGLIDWAAGQGCLTLHRVPIDVRAVLEGALAAGMAGLEQWARGWESISVSLRENEIDAGAAAPQPFL